MIMSLERAMALGASARAVDARHPFVLDDPAMMWLVASGSGELFTSAVDSGTPVGTRTFVGRAGQGDVLFSLGDESRGQVERLILLADEDLSLLQFPVAKVTEILPAAGLAVSDAVDAWVLKLSALLSDGTTAAAAERISEAGALTLSAEHSVRAARDAVAWVRIDDGELCLRGIPELGLRAGPSYLPFGGGIWLTASAATTATAAFTQDLVGDDDLLEGLRLLHSLVIRHLRLREAEETHRELHRLKRRAKLQHSYTSSALDGMAAVLNPRPVIAQRETPLLSALSLVGRAVGVEIKAPPKSVAADRFDDPVSAICRASRVRHRRVLLRHQWWKSDCGPLLAHRLNDHQPVALLRAREGRYEIVDPTAGGPIRVNSLTAAALGPEAVMIYPRLPVRMREPRQLLTHLLRGKIADLLFLLSLAALATVIGMLTPLATALVMDKAIPGADARLLVELGLVLIAAAFGAAIFQLAQGIVSIRMATASDAAAQPAVWDRLLSLRVAFFNRFTRGDLLARVTAVSEVSKQLNGATVQSLLAALMSLLNLGLLAYFSLRLALIAVGLAAAVGVATVAGGYFINRHVRLLLELRGQIFGLVVQMVNAVSKIRVAGAQRRAFTKWVGLYTRQLELSLKAQAAEDCVTVFNQSVPAVSATLLFWIAVEMLMYTGGVDGAPQMSIGIFLAFYAALGAFLTGVTSLSNTIVEALETLSQGKRVQPILEAEQEVDESKVDPARLTGAVQLSHVEFRYAEGGRRILDDLSILADPGEFVAIVGPSGSGKSTIFKLILGFETPQSGTVSFDGQDLRSLDTTAVRRQLGVVLQSGRITAGSILDNIGAGAHITLEEAWAAAEDAGLAEDIHALPMGFHTVVSEGGTNFSGGQRQRLLIARALARNPRILLMDEATSALDNKTQAIITASLKRRQVTKLVIAHRFSTIRPADRVYVLDRGRVVEVGSYNELAANDGLFASMMSRQVA